MLQFAMFAQYIDSSLDPCVCNKNNGNHNDKVVLRRLVNTLLVNVSNSTEGMYLQHFKQNIYHILIGQKFSHIEKERVDDSITLFNPNVK